jgi:hypothetical protein
LGSSIAANSGSASDTSGLGGSGAVRIIWPGDQRSFPSTFTANI